MIIKSEVDDTRSLLNATVKHFESFKKLSKDEEYQIVSEIMEIRKEYKETLFRLKYVREFMFNIFSRLSYDEILGKKKINFYSNEQMSSYKKLIEKYKKLYVKKERGNKKINKLVDYLQKIPVHYSIMTELYDTIMNLYDSNIPDEILKDYYLNREKLSKLIVKLKEVGKRKHSKEMYLANHSFRYVTNLAKKYGEKNPTLIMDLIQEGCISVIKAIEGFVPKFNTRFNTYANILIKQGIIDHLSGIKHHIYLTWAQRSNMAKIEKEKGKGNVHVEDIIDVFKCKKDKALGLMYNYNMALSLSQITSTGDKVKEDNIGDLLIDKKAEIGFEEVHLEDLLNSYHFTDDEKQIIKLKFLHQVPDIDADETTILSEKFRQSLYDVLYNVSNHFRGQSLAI